MSLLVIVLISAAFLLLAYRFYGGLLAKLLRLDADKETPSVTMRDDVDYAPIEPKFLLSQHFSAIAAAGPIVGPILAGVMFGWLPALIWILLGCVFIGGVHDFTALVASVRHRARSIAEVVREHMTRRSYVLFLTFVWIALVYIIVAFTDITAASFVGVQTLESGQKVSGGAIATSSLLYLALPIVMGLLMRFTKLSLNWATLIFLPLVAVAIWVGQFIPFDLAGMLGLEQAHAHKAWDVLLLGYCFVASVVPMWILLQPRGHLGGYFLLFALFGGALGLMFGGKTAQYPAFVGWTTPKGETLFPILFITIACGACSGFHSIIASGTTSKQLRRETDAKLIGYGSMLLEGMVAVVSLCCVMMLAANAPLLKNPQPNFIYAQGIGSFLEVIGIPAAFGISFGLMAFTTFVYDTLDVCTRLGRYILQELTGWKGRGGRWLATAITAAVPLLFVMQTTYDAKGNVIPAWKVFWSLFGASNQLLAALTLLGVTVWLARTRRAKWVWWVTGLPTVWMYVMSMWALLVTIKSRFVDATGFHLTRDPVPWVALVLVGLAVLMLVEAIRVFFGTPPPRETETVPVIETA
ncbi:MAG: carbon starvation protein A [Verrucomicrobiales bacterium]